MKYALLALLVLTAPAVAQQATTASGGELRVLDKLNGTVTDVSLSTGQSQSVGYLSVTLNECRYPTSNPSGDSYADLTVTYRDNTDPSFKGWMIASAPALNAMEHPRYDVWVLRCIRS